MFESGNPFSDLTPITPAETHKMVYTQEAVEEVMKIYREVLEQCADCLEHCIDVWDGEFVSLNTQKIGHMIGKIREMLDT